MAKPPHPPGTKIALHTTVALDRIIGFIESNRRQFTTCCTDADDCLDILKGIRNGREGT